MKISEPASSSDQSLVGVAVVVRSASSSSPPARWRHRPVHSPRTCGASSARAGSSLPNASSRAPAPGSARSTVHRQVHRARWRARTRRAAPASHRPLGARSRDDVEGDERGVELVQARRDAHARPPTGAVDRHRSRDTPDTGARGRAWRASRSSCTVCGRARERGSARMRPDRELVEDHSASGSSINGFIVLPSRP